MVFGAGEEWDQAWIEFWGPDSDVGKRNRVLFEKIGRLLTKKKDLNAQESKNLEENIASYLGQVVKDWYVPDEHDNPDTARPNDPSEDPDAKGRSNALFAFEENATLATNCILFCINRQNFTKKSLRKSPPSQGRSSKSRTKQAAANQEAST